MSTNNKGVRTVQVCALTTRCREQTMHNVYLRKLNG